MQGAEFPRFRPVADSGLLVEFADRIDEAANALVIDLDARLSRAGVPGLCEMVPAFVSLLLVFDPMLTDHAELERAVRLQLTGSAAPRVSGRTHEIRICHDAEFAPDLAEVAALVGRSETDVIEAHVSASYRVVMYGFAPGYAYLSGLPKALHLPRKPAAKRGVPAGSVIIAGAQCLTTTLTMPTGWWIIGRSPDKILRDDPDRPFLFDVGDTVKFSAIGRAEFDAIERQGGRP